MLFDPQVRAVGMTSDNPERAVLPTPSVLQAISEPPRTRKYRPGSAGHDCVSWTSTNPPAVSSVATVAHTWNGDGDESTKLHKPSASAPVREAAPARAVREV